MSSFKLLVVATVAIATSGCSSFFSPRPPVVEDKVGIRDHEVIGTLSTAPDYRVVYVKLKPDATLCAEASADAGALFSSAFAASAGVTTSKQSTIDAKTTASLAVAMKQLFKRSQGVQLYRDGAFALCNLYLNANSGTREGFSVDAYLRELAALRADAYRLIKVEVPYLGNLSYDPIVTPLVKDAGKAQEPEAPSTTKPAANSKPPVEATPPTGTPTEDPELPAPKN